jgi:DNA-binding NtrC family response regulator
MMSTSTTMPNEPGTGEHLSILVGAPDPLLRERLASALRLQGHEVLEAADAQAMHLRLDENTERTGKPLDLILCGGLFAEKEDPELAQRLTSGVSRALVLIPSGGFLSTATRAQRLGATAVMAELPAGKKLWEILRMAAGEVEAQSEATGVDVSMTVVACAR